MVAPAIAIAFAVGRVVASRVITRHALRLGSAAVVKGASKVGYRIASTKAARHIGGRVVRSKGKRLAAGTAVYRSSRYVSSGSQTYQRSKSARYYGYYSSAKSGKGHYQRYRSSGSKSSRGRSYPGRRRYTHTTASGYTYSYYRKRKK
jgi:hypothetical protein